jgi:hypothetical protein
MAKYIFKTVSQDVLDAYDIADTSKIHLVSAYGGYQPVYLLQNPTLRAELHYKITKPVSDTLTGKGYKKAFVVPNCPMPMDRLKSCLKEHKITVTTDLDVADVIITHDKIEDNFENGNNISTKVLLAKLWNYYAVHTSHTNLEESLLYQYDKDSDKFGQHWHLDDDDKDSIYDMDYITGLALELAFKIDAGMDTVSVSVAMNESATKQVLTQEMLSMLMAQLDGSDEDKELAYKILPTIDHKTNYHLLWKLAQTHGYDLSYTSRNKDLQYWYNKSDMETFYDFSAEQMIIWLQEKNLLNSINFRYLEPICREQITIQNRDLYVFNVKVKPEYQKFLKNE